jgi:Zn-dependent protease with chaperone function
MDFFGAQARARQQSRLLGWGFAACLLAVVLVLNAAVLTALRVGYASGDHPEPYGNSLTEWALLHPGPVFWTTLLVGGFIGCASLFRMMQLREGGGYVARSVGGVRVERSTPDPRRRLLHNVVEEMALASGVPVPEVYVLERDNSINAFAAGHTPANAAVTVTYGALQRLNRDQLQGVIAHEFSHILNGDMRLSIRLMGLIFGLMAVAMAGRMLIRFSGSGDKRVAPMLVLGLGIAIVGQVGFWGGRILQAWISRKRECLADASAVQFTRNPDGLRDALIRAAAGPRQPFGSVAMEEVAHMLFAPGPDRWLATHPPLLERVHALDANVNQAQLESMIRRAQTQWQRDQAEQPPASAAPADSRIAHAATVPAAAALIAATIGAPRAQHLDYAVTLRRALPAALRASAEAPEQAQVLLLALISFTDPALRERQLERIASVLGPEVAQKVQQAVAITFTLEPLLRLPAVLQLFPALRALPIADRATLMQLLRQLTRMDGKISVFEYSLEKLALRGLAAPSRPRDPHGRMALGDRSNQLGIVFAVLARHGARDEAQARHAYEAGIASLLPRERPPYAVLESWVPLFDQALEDLCALQVTAKQLLIEGLVRTIAHDELLAPSEAELLRTICAVLECPLPPVLSDAREPTRFPR